MAVVNGVATTSTYGVEFRQSQQLRNVTVNGKQMPRTRHEGIGQCVCLAVHGQQHYVGCDYEKCPDCGGNLVNCGCLNRD